MTIEAVRALVDQSQPFAISSDGIEECRELPFRDVDLAALRAPLPPLPLSYWGTYLPPGHVTIFGAHGGGGKSTMGAQLTVCLTAGIPYLGRPVRRSRVCYYSGEDPASLVLHRLQKACAHFGVDPAVVIDGLRLIDATEGIPTLFAERRHEGLRSGVTTASYEALREFIETNEIDVLIVDNASDVFDGDEINRSLVRSFMRSLALLVRERGGAVLLLAHVDKNTARGSATGSDSYSGSTAWHNSARSRLFLRTTEPGQMELVHEKSNLGPREETLSLVWPKDGLPQLDAPLSGVVQHIAENNDRRAILGLLHEFTERREYVSTSATSHSNAAKLFRGQKAYPKRRKPNEVFDLLRDAERDGLIARVVIRTEDRKTKETWGLTTKGYAYLGVDAPSAPSAPSCTDGADSHDGAGGAPSAPSCGGGVWGGERAHGTDGGEGA
jgi:hypothetical protein